ncbi:MAG: DUF2500 domain-containing protein [Ruminococcaceae bacterium]|nr:DUF2500 domain-containing protein [Oscillospiraceae bacterium]
MGFSYGMGFNQGFRMFHLFGTLFTLMFVLVFGIFIVMAVKGIRQWNRNNHSPRLTVPATVVARRTNITRRHHHGAGSLHHHTSTTYYVTFQVDSGDRMELSMDGAEYGLLVEGDRGQLTFQGTRYLGFERV